MEFKIIDRRNEVTKEQVFNILDTENKNVFLNDRKTELTLYIKEDSAEFFLSDNNFNNYRVNKDYYEKGMELEILIEMIEGQIKKCEELEEMINSNMDNKLDSSIIEHNAFWEYGDDVKGTDIDTILQVSNYIYCEPIARLKNIYYDYFNNGLCNYIEYNESYNYDYDSNVLDSEEYFETMELDKNCEEWDFVSPNTLELFQQEVKQCYGGNFPSQWDNEAIRALNKDLINNCYENKAVLLKDLKATINDLTNTNDLILSRDVKVKKEIKNTKGMDR